MPSRKMHAILKQFYNEIQFYNKKMIGVYIRLGGQARSFWGDDI